MTPHPLTARLVLVRHGRTSWNERGLFQGHADIPLDHLGHQQARQLVRALAPLEPAAIAVSDLTRARQTAAPLAEAVGLDPVVDARLREVDVGTWEGLTREEAARRYPEEYAAYVAGEDVARGHGETRAHGGRRAADAVIDHVQAAGPGSVVVVVSHGLALVAALEELTARGIVALVGPPPRFANAGWIDLVATVPAPEAAEA